MVNPETGSREPEDLGPEEIYRRIKENRRIQDEEDRQRAEIVKKNFMKEMGFEPEGSDPKKEEEWKKEGEELLAQEREKRRKQLERN